MALSVRIASRNYPRLFQHRFSVLDLVFGGGDGVTQEEDDGYAGEDAEEEDEDVGECTAGGGYRRHQVS